MPHTQIVFVKVKMELLEDDRFLFDLNDRQKGLYILLLTLAGKTNNSIRNNIDFIKQRLNLKEVSMSDIEHISKIFPKFILDNDYWRFEKFEEHHNWHIGSTEGAPKDAQNKNKKENKIKNKNKEAGRFAPPSQEEVSKYFLEELKSDEQTHKNFFDYFQSNGWLVGGKARMSDWRAAARRWERNKSQFQKPDTGEKILIKGKWVEKKYAKLFGGE